MSEHAWTAEETLSLAEAKRVVSACAAEQSLLLLAPPGVGKTALVQQAAAEAGMRCVSLLGTQLAPEDVSGVPKLVGERSVFCPPRAVLPEGGEPFVLFLDEILAASFDVQKSLYSLLLERRVGEHRLPEGSWVVAASNRPGDRALVRGASAALLNRLFVLHVETTVDEWLAWARGVGLREEVVRFIELCPDALQGDEPRDDGPFSTPRAWASLAAALDRLEQAGAMSHAARRALVHGRVSPEDAAEFLAVTAEMKEIEADPVQVLFHLERLPERGAYRARVLERLRERVGALRLGDDVQPWQLDSLFGRLSREEQRLLLLDREEEWRRLKLDVEGLGLPVASEAAS